MAKLSVGPPKAVVSEPWLPKVRSVLPSAFSRETRKRERRSLFFGDFEIRLVSLPATTIRPLESTASVDSEPCLGRKTLTLPMRLKLGSAAPLGSSRSIVCTRTRRSRLALADA